MLHAKLSYANITPVLKMLLFVHTFLKIVFTIFARNKRNVSKRAFSMRFDIILRFCHNENLERQIFDICTIFMK